MATIWGTQLSGSLQQINQDRELKIGDKLKLKQQLEIKVGLMMPSIKRVEKDVIDEIIKTFPEEQGIEPKFISIEVIVGKSQPYPDTWVVIGYLELHGIIIHESPINWGLLVKVILGIVAFLCGTQIGQIVVIFALAWLFTGHVLPQLTNFAPFIIVIFVLFITYVFLKGAKGRIRIQK